MNVRSRIICSFCLGFTILFFSLYGTLKSQDGVAEADKVYGLDPTLYNGIKYTYFFPSGTGSHQYLNSTEFITGSVILKGKIYDDVLLNYDIYNQLLLLKYADETGVLNIIQVSTAWLGGFHLGNMQFTYCDYGKGRRFYQVLGTGPVKILNYWRKDLNLKLAYGTSEYTFSPPLRESFILKDGSIKTYRNNRNLLKIFDPGMRPDIKDYLRKNRIKVKKASDKEMTNLINYINTLL